MSFPTDSHDDFVTMVDHRLTPVDNSESYEIPEEPSDPTVYTEERPTEGTLFVTGSITFTEVSYEPTQSGEFYVNYNTGQILFHEDDRTKVVTVVYQGVGSASKAVDWNNVYTSIQNTQDEVTVLRDLLLAGKVEATDPVSKKVQVYGGTFYPTAKIPATLTDTLVDFASPPYLLSAITVSYWRPILLVVDPDGDLEVIEGTISATETDFSFPGTFELAYRNYLVICEIHVRDNGTGAPGTIIDITDDKIFDRRPLVASGAPIEGVAPPANSVVLWPSSETVPTGWLRIGTETLSLGGVEHFYIKRT